MKTILTVFLLLTFVSVLEAQNQMKPVEELINLQEPAWDFVSQWIKEAKNPVEVLACDPIKA